METRAEVALNLLGGFRAEVDGHPVPDSAWPSKRSRELVQLLALAERHALVRDQVLEALWPHLSLDAAGANLRKAAHHVRQALGDQNSLVLRQGMVYLFPQRVIYTDVESFRQHAEEALASADVEVCARAAQLYPGDLLPAAPYEEWTKESRDQLRSTYLTLLRATRQWSKVVALERTDEPAYEELMRDAIARGRRAAAIEWYGKLRAALAEELGVLPAPKTRDLYDECVRGLAPSKQQFVGRQRQLAVVSAVLRQQGAARVSVVMVSGSAGIGKSAFCREVSRLGDEEGWYGVCVEVETPAQPFAVVRSAVEFVLQQQPSLLNAIREPVLAALLSPQRSATGTLTRHQVVGAFQRLLLTAGGHRPVLLFVDDAHLADEGSIDVLYQLAVTARSVVVVLACRDRPLRPRLKRCLELLHRGDRLLPVALSPLSEDDATRLVAQSSFAEIAADMTARIVARAAGNPFALVELARASDQTDAISATMGDLITARLVDVDPAMIAVLRRLALAGGDLDSSTVIALTGSSEEEAFAVLDAALTASVLTVLDGRYRFCHELVRDALVSQIPPHQQLSIHRDAARRLGVLGAAPAVVAWHWIAGGRPLDAVEPLLAAAYGAVTLGSFADGVAYLDTLLVADPQHGEALRLRAECLDFMGDMGALRAYDRAIEAADEGVDDLRAQRALAQLKQGDPVGALNALQGVYPSTVEGQLAEALTYSGAAALGFIDPAMGSRKAAACRRLALRTGDAAGIVVASWAQAAAAHARGELRESVLADIRDTAALPHLAGRIFDGHLCVTQRLLYGARPYDDVVAFADALIAEARRLGAGRGAAFGTTLRGEAELLAGRLDEADRDLHEGLRLHRGVAGATGEALTLQRLSELSLLRGQVSEAEARLDEALEVARATDVGFHLLDRIFGTRITLSTDPEEALTRLEEAEESVRGTLETCPGCRITLAVPAAIAAARGGDLGRATDYESSVAFLADTVMRLPAWYAALDEVRAHLAAARGDSSGSRAKFESAAERFSAAGQPLDALRCRKLVSSG